MAKIHETKIKITSDHKNAVKGLKAVKSAAGGLVPSFNQVKTGALVMTAAIAGATVAIWAMVKSTAAAGDEFDKMSKRLGVSVETLSELKFAAELSGSSIEDIEKSMKKLSLSALNAERGLSTYTRAFNELGVEVTDTNGDLKDTETLFNEVSVALAGVESNTEKTALAQELLGKSGSKLIPLFKEGVGGIEALREEARLLGITFSTDAAAASAAFIDSQQRLTDSITGTKNAISGDLMPPMTQFFNASAKWIALHREDVLNMSKDWATSIGAMAQSVLVGGAQVIDFFDRMGAGVREIRLRMAQAEMKFFESQQKAGMKLTDSEQMRYQELHKLSAQLLADQVAWANDTAAVDKVKNAIAEIQELIKTSEVEPIVPNLLDPVDEGVDFEVTESPRVLATQREIEQLNAMWEAQTLSERERLDLWYLEQQEKAAGSWQMMIQLEEIYLAKKKKLNDKEKKDLTERQKFEAMSFQKQTKFVSGQLEAITAAGAKENKAFFLINKLAAGANAIVNTSEGVTAALKLGPIGIPLAGIIAAAGAIEIANIAGTSFAGGGGGGGSSVSAAEFASPSLPSIPEPTDLVTSPEATDRGHLTINIHNEGNLVDMSNIMDDIGAHFSEWVGDGVIDLNVT